MSVTLQYEPDDPYEKRDQASVWPSLLLLFSFLAHVVVCPYTKVEESWTLHAVHDILEYGVTPSNLHEYDHFEHPGPVPRTFLGPLFLSALSYPFHLLCEHFVWGRLNPLFTQIIVRFALALVNVQAVYFFARRAARVFGRKLADRFLVLTALQFHLAFWAGRTVPNMLAFPLAITALALMLFPDTPSANGKRDNRLQGFGLLCIVAAVFRAEVAALVLPMGGLLLQQRIPPRRLVLTAAIWVVPVLVLAIAVDSHFWQRRLLWAELQGVIFNVFYGKSAQWGTSPFYAYFLSLLPRLLHVWLPLALYAAWIDTPSLTLLAPAFASITLLSLLGHKEWRFIVYVVPLFNVAALQGETFLNLHLRRFARARGLPCPSLFWLLLLPTTAFTLLAVWLSQQNYPGGHAMAELHRLKGSLHAGHVVVQIDAYTAMTGASLFTHVREHVGWTYDRAEDLSRYPDLGAFDYLVTSRPHLFNHDHFRPLTSVLGYAGLSKWHGLKILPRFEPKVWILGKVAATGGRL